MNTITYSKADAEKIKRLRQIISQSADFKADDAEAELTDILKKYGKRWRWVRSKDFIDYIEIVKV